MDDKKIFNAKVRQAVLKADISGYTAAEIQEALGEIWDKSSPQDFILLKFNVYNGKENVEKKIITNEDYIEEYGCTRLALCEKSFKRIYGRLPEMSKEKIVLYGDDATLLYQDLHTFVRENLKNEFATNLFFDEMEVDKPSKNVKTSGRIL